MIPEERKEDVILLNPSDVDYPIGFNLLQVKDNEEREYIVKEMQAILKRFIFEYFNITSGDIAGPIFFQHMQNNMLLATSDAEIPGTMAEFINIFQSDDYWKRWLPLKWKNRQLENWVNDILPNTRYNRTTSEGHRNGDYFAAKFVDFVNDPRIALIFGQPFSTIDLAEIIENKKILLVNLSRGLLGEANSSMFGMILMAKFNAAFMQRLKKTGEDKELSTFYLYVDEFQSIATENFSILLAEARKFGLGLILANQYIRQIASYKIRDAIFGNVGTIISFRLGIDDAQIMESQFLPQYNFEELCNLPNHNAIIRTQIKGMRTIPCNFKTVLPDYPYLFAEKEEVIRSSRQKYGTPKNVTEFLIDSSLANERLKKSIFYWEKKGTPKKQLIRNNNLIDMLGIDRFREDHKPFVIAGIELSLRRKIIHYLLNEKKVSRFTVAEILYELDVTDERLIDNINQVLARIFEPQIGLELNNIIGIYNFYMKSLIENRLDSMEEDLTEKDHQNAITNIKGLCKKDYWFAASSNFVKFLNGAVKAQNITGETKSIFEKYREL